MCGLFLFYVLVDKECDLIVLDLGNYVEDRNYSAYTGNEAEQRADERFDLLCFQVHKNSVDGRNYSQQDQNNNLDDCRKTFEFVDDFHELSPF